MGSYGIFLFMGNVTDSKEYTTIPVDLGRIYIINRTEAGLQRASLKHHRT